MARYIDADALYRRVKEKTNPYGKPTLDYESGVKVLNMIEQTPTADVAEVKHGYFVRNERNIPKMKEFHERGYALSMNPKSIFYTCSECGEWISLSQKYCSECGAKMDIKTT